MRLFTLNVLFPWLKWRRRQDALHSDVDQRMSHMGPYRNEVSAFLHLIAEKLFDAAGPFGLDELDVARHESKCAARKLLTEKWHARDALAHIRGAVARRAECAPG